MCCTRSVVCVEEGGDAFPPCACADSGCLHARSDTSRASTPGPPGLLCKRVLLQRNLPEGLPQHRAQPLLTFKVYDTTCKRHTLTKPKWNWLKHLL